MISIVPDDGCGNLLPGLSGCSFTRVVSDVSSHPPDGCLTGRGMSGGASLKPGVCTGGDRGANPPKPPVIPAAGKPGVGEPEGAVYCRLKNCLVMLTGCPLAPSNVRDSRTYKLSAGRNFGTS